MRVISVDGDKKKHRDIQKCSRLPQQTTNPACQDGMYQGGARNCSCDGHQSNRGRPALLLWAVVVAAGKIYR